MNKLIFLKSCALLFCLGLLPRLSAQPSKDQPAPAGMARITPGRCLIAPGDRHLLVERRGATYFAVLDDGPRVGLHKPAVNVLFDSLVKASGKNTIAAILTGMGKDGASGITALRQAGAHTIGQDEATCVVYGMPKEAQALGGIIEELPMDAIAKANLTAVQRHGQRTSFS
jgi:two-component system chemotaxis response regulator CheB